MSPLQPWVIPSRQLLEFCSATKAIHETYLNLRNFCSTAKRHYDPYIQGDPVSGALQEGVEEFLSVRIESLSLEVETFFKFQQVQEMADREPAIWSALQAV